MHERIDEIQLRSPHLYAAELLYRKRAPSKFFSRFLISKNPIIEDIGI